MRYHVVLTDHIGLEIRKAESSKGLAPRHFLQVLAAQLDGVLYEPQPKAPLKGRRAPIHRILKTPDHLINLAQEVVANCEDEDVIFCLGEAIALPIAYELSEQKSKTKLASFGHNLYRPRIQVANSVWKCMDRVEMFFVFTEEAATKSPRNVLYYEQTDDVFFSPCDAASEKPISRSDRKPIVVSVGLEMRDNTTLAEATRDLDLDVRITAFSKNADLQPRALPKPLPNNMTSKFYSWPELSDLYRVADIVVVPILPTSYAAGITSLLEGTATARPVIATANDALKSAVGDQGMAVWVPAENPKALRSKILEILDDDEKRQTLAQTGYKAQKKHHRFETKVTEMVKALSAL